MVRGDYQNKGVGTALFALAFARVRSCSDSLPLFRWLTRLTAGRRAGRERRADRDAGLERTSSSRFPGGRSG